MNILNESVLRDMMLQIVKETRTAWKKTSTPMLMKVIKEIGLCKPNF